MLKVNAARGGTPSGQAPRMLWAGTGTMANWFETITSRSREALARPSSARRAGSVFSMVRVPTRRCTLMAEAGTIRTLSRKLLSRRTERARRADPGSSSFSRTQIPTSLMRSPQTLPW